MLPRLLSKHGVRAVAVAFYMRVQQQPVVVVALPLVALPSHPLKSLQSLSARAAQNYQLSAMAVVALVVLLVAYRVVAAPQYATTVVRN